MDGFKIAASVQGERKWEAKAHQEAPQSSKSALWVIVRETSVEVDQRAVKAGLLFLASGDGKRRDDVIAIIKEAYGTLEVWGLHCR